MSENDRKDRYPDPKGPPNAAQAHPDSFDRSESLKHTGLFSGLAGRRRRTVATSPILPAAEVLYGERCELNIFGISMSIPTRWRIVPVHGQVYRWSTGFLKLEEDLDEIPSRVSGGLRWESSEIDNESFMPRYFASLEEQSRRKLKSRKEDFQMLNQEIIEVDGQRMCFVVSQYNATQGLFKTVNRMETIQILNIAFCCEQSARIVTGNLIARPERIEADRGPLMDILCSIRSLPAGRAPDLFKS